MNIKEIGIITGKILLFFIGLIIVFIPSYYYIYKGFIDIYNNNGLRVITEETIIEKEKKEETINFLELLNDNTIFLKTYLEPFINLDNSIYFNIELKEEGINQINDLIGKKLFVANTLNEIEFNAEKVEGKELYIISIEGFINNRPIVINGIYDKEEEVFILDNENDIKLDGLMTILNNQGFYNYKKHDFGLQYKELFLKKIRLNELAGDIIDLNIPKRKESDFINILRSIDGFLEENDLINNNSINIELGETILSDVRNYIINSNRLSTGQKQELLIDVNSIISLFNKTQIFISKEKIEINNNESQLLFNFSLLIDKNTTTNTIEIDNKMNNQFYYTPKEMFDIFLSKNPLLVKYLNNEDFSFLLP